MNCENKIKCDCPKKNCPNNGICCKCILKHKNTESLPYCLFLDNEGDKSIKNYYIKLKQKFEN